MQFSVISFAAGSSFAALNLNKRQLKVLGNERMTYSKRRVGLDTVVFVPCLYVGAAAKVKSGSEENF